MTCSSMKYASTEAVFDPLLMLLGFFMLKLGGEHCIFHLALIGQPGKLHKVWKGLCSHRGRRPHSLCTQSWL